jgi:hypothetical protein
MSGSQSAGWGHAQFGERHWAYLETMAFQTRYVLAANFVRDLKNIIEIGGWGRNVITNFLAGPHASVTVYSLEAEFEARTEYMLNGHPCTVRYIRDHFQNHQIVADRLGVVALGLDLVGESEPLLALLLRSERAVVEAAQDYDLSTALLKQIIEHPGIRVTCQINLDLRENVRLMRSQLGKIGQEHPIWRRVLYVIEPRSPNRAVSTCAEALDLANRAHRGPAISK